MNEKTPLSSLGGRKFTLSLVNSILASLLCWFDKIEPGIYSVVIVSIIGAFIAGNVTQGIQQVGQQNKG